MKELTIHPGLLIVGSVTAGAFAFPVLGLFGLAGVTIASAGVWYGAAKRVDNAFKKEDLDALGKETESANDVFLADLPPATDPLASLPVAIKKEAIVPTPITEEVAPTPPDPLPPSEAIASDPFPPLGQLELETAAEDEQWEPVQIELSQEDRPSQPAPTEDRNAINDLLGYPSILIYGAPGSGKSTLAEWLMYERLALGHEVEILDPHREYGQWEGLSVYGEGLNFEECNERLELALTRLKKRYEDRAVNPNFNPKPYTILCEEFTQWARKCSNASKFFQATVSDFRKANMHVVYVSHGRTLATVGGAGGFAGTRDASLLEVELGTMLHPVTGKAVPSMKGKICYPGQKRTPVLFSVPVLKQEKAIASPSATPHPAPAIAPVPVAAPVAESSVNAIAEAAFLAWSLKWIPVNQSEYAVDGFIRVAVLAQKFRYRGSDGRLRGLTVDEVKAIAESLSSQGKIEFKQEKGIKLIDGGQL